MTNSKKEPKKPTCMFRSFALDHPGDGIEDWINENYQNGYITMEYTVKTRIFILMIKSGDDSLGLTIPSLIKPIF